jgi:hypothetical protein
MIGHWAEETVDGRVRLITWAGYKEIVLDCTIEQYDKALRECCGGRSISEAFQFLSAWQCEWLESGMSEAQWNEDFKEQY